MLVPPDSHSQPVFSHTSSGHIPRRWLTLARGAWMVCALLLLANFVASIPAYSHLMLNVCTLPNRVPCTNPGQATPSWQLTPENVQALAQLHLSVAAYAAFFVTLNVVASLLCWGIGLLIFWRKSNEGMGLFVSLLLVFFGAIGFNDTFLGAYVPAQSPLLLQILLYLIQNAAWAALGAFLLTFPTGRFVPRWSWLLIALWLGLNILYPDSLGWPPVLVAAELLLVLGGTLGNYFIHPDGSARGTRAGAKGGARTRTIYETLVWCDRLRVAYHTILQLLRSAAGAEESRRSNIQNQLSRRHSPQEKKWRCSSALSVTQG